MPEFDLLPEPGGAWDWLLGLMAGGVVSIVLLIASRRLIKRRRPAEEDSDSKNAVDDEWEDRLDEELAEVD